MEQKTKHRLDEIQELLKTGGRVTAEEIEFEGGILLDDAIKLLLDARHNGQSVYGVFSGHLLHSDTISEDSAYLTVTGMTKNEFLEARAAYLKQQRSANEIARKKLPTLIERGKSIIFPERHTDWEQHVSVNARIYDSIYIEPAIKVMEALEEGKTIKETTELLESLIPNKEDWYYVQNTVYQYSRRGPEFYEETVSPNVLTPEAKKAIIDKKQENILLTQKYTQ